MVLSLCAITGIFVDSIGVSNFYCVKSYRFCAGAVTIRGIVNAESLLHEQVAQLSYGSNKKFLTQPYTPTTILPKTLSSNENRSHSLNSNKEKTEDGKASKHSFLCSDSLARKRILFSGART